MKRLNEMIRVAVRQALRESYGEAVEILPDGHYEKGTAYRPRWCYADGRLERDLGYDYFFLSSPPFHGAGDSLPTGKYPCVYNGRACSLYVLNHGGGRQEGLCCYDDDMESKASILDELF